MHTATRTGWAKVRAAARPHPPTALVAAALAADLTIFGSGGARADTPRTAHGMTTESTPGRTPPMTIRSYLPTAGRRAAPRKLGPSALEISRFPVRRA